MENKNLISSTIFFSLFFLIGVEEVIELNVYKLPVDDWITKLKDLKISEEKSPEDTVMFFLYPKILINFL